MFVYYLTQMDENIESLTDEIFAIEPTMENSHECYVEIDHIQGM